MIRTILVTIGGLILSPLIAAAAISFMLSHTQFGRMMSGDSSGFNWQVFMTGSKIMFFYVSFPTVILVAVFVGLLSKRSAMTAAAIAVLPTSVVASAFRLRNAWISLLLVICAVLLAYFSQRLVRPTVASAG
jgi:hypothetical protein